MTVGRLVGIVGLGAAIAAVVAWQQGYVTVGPDGLTITEGGANSTFDIYAKAKAKFALAQYPEAYANFVSALRQRPNDPEAATARFDMGKCLEEMGQKEQALQAYKAFVEDYPRDDRVDVVRSRIERLSLMK